MSGTAGSSFLWALQPHQQLQTVLFLKYSEQFRCACTQRPTQRGMYDGTLESPRGAELCRKPPLSESLLHNLAMGSVASREQAIHAECLQMPTNLRVADPSGSVVATLTFLGDNLQVAPR